MALANDNLALNGAMMMHGVYESGCTIKFILLRARFGMVELANEVASYAEAIENAYRACDAECGSEGLPSVFDYEVTLEFGSWLAWYIVNNKGVPDIKAAQAELDRLVNAFMADVRAESNPA